MKTNLLPLETPLVIDALRCRLRQDCEFYANQRKGSQYVTCTISEMRFIVEILGAAREFFRQRKPNKTERLAGAGGTIAYRESEDRLLRAIQAEISPCEHDWIDIRDMANHNRFTCRKCGTVSP